jgi:hypothetical protein
LPPPGAKVSTFAVLVSVLPAVAVVATRPLTRMVMVSPASRSLSPALTMVPKSKL